MILSKHYSTPPHEEEQQQQQQSQKLMDQGPLDPKSWAGEQPPSNNVSYRIPLPPPSTSTQPNPNHYAYGSPSNSRRGSLATVEPSKHTSPPSSPSHTQSRPSPLEHRPDLISTPSSPLHSPWRRDSLPSISQLTGEIPTQRQQQQQQQPHFNLTPFHSPNNPNQSNNNYSTAPIARPRHTSSPASLLLEDAHMRRHSIAIATPSHHHHHHHHHHHPPPPRPISAPKRDSISYPSSTNSSTCSSPSHEGYPTSIFSPPPSTLSSPATTRRHSHAQMVAPYSRSPELRVSHKLAERKRRKEMKDLFDDLRDLLPVDKGLKTSKWEILSKAVGYIQHLHEREQNFAKETEELGREIKALKNQRQ